MIKCLKFIASMPKKLAHSPLYVTTRHFAMLDLLSARKPAKQIPMEIIRHDAEHKCHEKVLLRIKGKAKKWEDRWRRGDICYVAYIHGEAVAHIWFCHNEWRLKDEDAGSPLPSKSAFLYDALTVERWRGNGIYPALISEAVDRFIFQGCEKVYALVDEKNAPACRSLEKLGFQQTGHRMWSYRFLRVFDFRRDTISFVQRVSSGQCVTCSGPVPQNPRHGRY